MKDYSNLFEEFPDHSKIYLFQSDRPLNSDEMVSLDGKLSEFTKDWASHGDQLMADGKVLNPFFSIVAVNDAAIQPSGCSIDVLTNFLSAFGDERGIDFLDRMKLTIQDGTEIKQINFSDIDNQKEDTLIYDPMVATLGEFRNEWPMPIKRSRYNQLVH